MITLKTLLRNVLESFLNNIHLVKENVPIVKKKRLLLLLPYLGITSSETRAKLQQALKGVLNCCQVGIFLKVKQGFPILPVTKPHAKRPYTWCCLKISVWSLQ